MTGWAAKGNAHVTNISVGFRSNFRVVCLFVPFSEDREIILITFVMIGEYDIKELIRVPVVSSSIFYLFFSFNSALEYRRQHLVSIL